MIDPKTFATVHTDDLKTVIAIQAKRMAQARTYLNGYAYLSLARVDGARVHIHETSGILLKPDEVTTVLALYPIARGLLIEFGVGDTEVRDALCDMVAAYFLESRWPIGKDGFTDHEMTQFIKALQQSARGMNYEVDDNLVPA